MGFRGLFSENKRRSMEVINDFLKRQVDEHKTPSVQYAFFDAGSTIYTFHDGLADIKAGKIADASTTYNLFSVTKTVTALAVLQLVQAGKVQLDAPVVKYLPGFPYPDDISIQQLLDHSSGIPNPLPLRWTHLLNEHDGFDRDNFFKQVFEKNNHLEFRPGSKFSYSNLGYVLLGQLIEKVSHKKYETYLQENIFDKTGTSQAELGFIIDPSFHAKGYQKYRSLVNAMLGFLINKKKMMGPREAGWKPFNLFYINGISYGGMIGSVSGLVKYGQALLKKDAGLLNEVYKKLLFTETIINNKPTGMSLSWYSGKFDGHDYFAHAGGGGGYYVELRLYPALEKGSVIRFNRTGLNDKRILDKADGYFINGLF
jgi:CubicO group peptidase (beta-lactamase class C family)